jgi:cell fate regulator YaaT (PSP1 superfamily)
MERMTDPIRPAVSVKFTRVGRVHIFLLPESVAGVPPAPGDEVVLRSADGPIVGTAVRDVPGTVGRKQPPPGSPDVFVRVATPEDIAARQKREQRERAAHQFCLLKLRERNLPMKLTRVEQLVDGSRLLFYFTADGRIDFRELVRDLAAEFRTRIEMRQIGVRDEARMLGGYGGCGRPLCCTTWLQSFEPVSIKMAKQQGLSLNPSKLSGLCGRLKCCLRYELPDGRADSKGETYAGAADERARGGCGQGARGCGQGACGCRGRVSIEGSVPACGSPGNGSCPR